MPADSDLLATHYPLLATFQKMLPATLSILRDPVPYHGAVGFFAFTTLERLNAYVGLMVGLATLVYLCLRIRREIRDRNAKPAPED
jgi:hypothetical protein